MASLVSDRTCIDIVVRLENVNYRKLRRQQRRQEILEQQKAKRKLAAQRNTLSNPQELEEEEANLEELKESIGKLVQESNDMLNIVDNLEDRPRSMPSLFWH